MNQPRKLLPAVASALSLFSAVASAEPGLAASEAAGSAGQPSRADCVAAHQGAQEFKRGGNFLEAQEKLSICSSRSCPGAIISDCGQWLDELEQKTPSMVFEVRRDGLEANDAKVFVDDQLVTDWVRALKVNPGRHTVRAELPPFQPILENLVLPEGQRMRLVQLSFKTQEAPPVAPAPAPAPVAPAALVRPVEPEPPARRPTPFLVYPLLGVSAAGGVGFAVFALIGRSQQSDLEKQCEPNCTDADLKPMKRNYLIADVSAAVGGAALLSAAILYLARPEEAPRLSGDITWSVGPVVAGAPESLGVSASRTW